MCYTPMFSFFFANAGRQESCFRWYIEWRALVCYRFKKYSFFILTFHIEVQQWGWEIENVFKFELKAFQKMIWKICGSKVKRGWSFYFLYLKSLLSIFFDFLSLGMLGTTKRLAKTTRNNFLSWCLLVTIIQFWILLFCDIFTSHIGMFWRNCRNVISLSLDRRQRILSWRGRGKFIYLYIEVSLKIIGTSQALRVFFNCILFGIYFSKFGCPVNLLYK